MRAARCCWKAASTGSRCPCRRRTWISSRPRPPPPAKSRSRSACRPCLGISRRPLDHHVARVREGLADERDAAQGRLGEIRVAERHAAHPFGARPRLAGAAAAEHQPDGPGIAPSAQAGHALVRPAAQRPMAERADEIGLRPGGRRFREPPPPPQGAQGGKQARRAGR